MVIRPYIFADVIVAKQAVVGANPDVALLGYYAFDEIAIQMEARGEWRRHKVALVVSNEFHKAVVDASNHLSIKFIQSGNGRIEFRTGMQDVDIGNAATRIKIKPYDGVSRRYPDAATRIFHYLKYGGIGYAHYIDTTVRQRLCRAVCGEVHDVDAIVGGYPEAVVIVLADRMDVVALDTIVAAVVEMHKIVAVVLQEAAAHRANPYKTVAVLIDAVHKIVGQTVIDSQVRKQVIGRKIAAWGLRNSRQRPKH